MANLNFYYRIHFFFNEGTSSNPTWDNIFHYKYDMIYLKSIPWLSLIPTSWDLGSSSLVVFNLYIFSLQDSIHVQLHKCNPPPQIQCQWSGTTPWHSLIPTSWDLGSSSLVVFYLCIFPLQDSIQLLLSSKQLCYHCHQWSCQVFSTLGMYSIMLLH